jgi:hypothetical protein
MSRVCTICTSPHRETIDAALVEGKATSRAIAATFGCSRSSLQRHSEAHIPRALAQAVARKAEAHEDSLHDLVHELDADARRIQAAAEKEGDLRTAVMCVKERRGLVEMRARVAGLLRAPAAGANGPLVTVNATNGRPIDLDEARRYVRLFQELEADDVATASTGTVQVLEPAKIGGQP